MSEYINNRQMRQKTIKDIIRQLHEGKTVDEVKTQFEEVFHGVSATEISEAEGALIAEGLPVEEVQKLCDVHAAVFKGSIEEIHQPEQPALIPGHPVHVLVKENKKISHILEKEIRPFLSLTAIDDPGAVEQLKAGVDQLKDLSIHYKKKENLYFPYMEKYGITAPPKVMWGVDDEIRARVKEVAALLEGHSDQTETLIRKVQDMADKIEEMIFKEENIMVPMLLENLTQEEWKTIADGSGEIGYMIEDVPQWEPKEADKEENAPTEPEAGIVKLPSGEMKTEELTALLNTLPFDITFVNKDDKVKYFSEGKNRAFPRTRTILGRNVSNCHPPASVHIVEKIVEDFKNGVKDEEDFWIRMGKKYILIRYYAVRSEAGEYLGVLEVTQDIDEIQNITGEKRLMSE
ncbi:DUF438 domain-containing protein [Lacrimispora amygdalina]|uniref:DUF438 domain-containing protein n=1 Tax=Lacrimispora amygdalina TaxID=253257 RepID=A0A3E2NCU6_9FIRM|nr:DUF438 domain-containing protein [Clostridium indicum]RFZ78849.1 DUF438 domain-containing protein [Clostridium indicum]